MSSNQITRIDDNFRRDSFDDRVCDDLCEVLLQFLPVKDKFKFECVSKQFQKNVYQRQEILYLIDVRYEVISKRLQGYNLFYLIRSDFDTQIEAILRKLPNIKSLIFNTREYMIEKPMTLKDSQIDLIEKYCHKLTQINCDLILISAEKRDSFAKKFGQKLVSINAKLYFNEFNWIQESFPKIKELISWFIIPSLPMNKLKKFEITLIEGYISHKKNYQNWVKFIENHKSLTHLSISLFVFEEQLYDSVFKQLSKLDQLVDLKFRIRTDMKLMVSKMRQLSANCLKLKSFSVDYHFTDLPLLPSFLSEVKKFKALERLEFGLYFNFNELNFEEYFNGLQSLTHLTIDIFNSFNMKNDLLKGIDKSLPKLLVLNMKVPGGGSIEVSEQTTDSLARLSRLESLEITVNNESIRDLIMSKVIKNCKKLKTIDIKVNKF